MGVGRGGKLETGWLGGAGGRGRGGRRRGSYKSQCKSRDKYYLRFEERHSRYLLYRGKGPAMSGTQVRPGSKENVCEGGCGGGESGGGRTNWIGREGKKPKY